MNLDVVNLSRLIAWIALIFVAFGAPARAASLDRAQQQPAFVINNVDVFDGERRIPRATVVVEDRTISSVGRRARVPDGAEVIDGSGMTLLPGLIDSHSHDEFGRHLLRSALMFGVTTDLEMFATDPKFAAEMRREQADGLAFDRADLFSAGIGVTAPGGHGTRYGVTIPTITDPAQAQAFVDARIAEGSDYIKIILEDWAPRGSWPTLSAETLKAVVAAAKRRGKLAVVHVSDEAHARLALEAGADGLVHVYWNGQPAADIARLARRGAFVIPTLTVIESFMGVPGGESLASDPRFAPYLLDEQLTTLRSKAPKDRKYGPHESYRVAAEMVRLLDNAGASILAGSDCPNPGTAHGVSLHREMELLVQAGLSPKEALMAATSAPAEAFRLKDRGRIKPGLRADLLLVRGDPTRDILATRDIVGVWKEGKAVDREGYRTELQRNMNGQGHGRGFAPSAAAPGPSGD